MGLEGGVAGVRKGFSGLGTQGPLQRPGGAVWLEPKSRVKRHEIKRRLLLGRKVMTNLDSILKSRDITLPTKVQLVKTMIFPVVMYGCESWTIKKAEC